MNVNIEWFTGEFMRHLKKELAYTSLRSRMLRFAMEGGGKLLPLVVYWELPKGFEDIHVETVKFTLFRRFSDCPQEVVFSGCVRLSCDTDECCLELFGADGKHLGAKCLEFPKAQGYWDVLDTPRWAAEQVAMVACVLVSNSINEEDGDDK